MFAGGLAGAFRRVRALRRCLSPPLAALAFAAWVPCSGAAAADAADLVLRNASIHTMDAANPRASALAIRSGRLAYVGDAAGVAAHIGARTRVADLDGRAVIPGLHDSHMHPMSAGLWLLRCQLGEARTLVALKVAVRACAAARSGNGWLLGRGWRERLWGDARPTRAALDALVPDRPACLLTVEGDVAWVNSAALAAAGIDAASADPPDGSIERAAGSGAPSGVLRGTAVALVMRHAPRPTEADLREALRRASAMANAHGITAVIDASVGPEMLAAYRAADSAGELTVRVVASQWINSAQGLAQVDALVARAAQSRGRRLRADAAKIFLDGEIDGRTAALLEPYADGIGDRGQLKLEPPALDALVLALDAAGIQLHVHAMGDRATRVALDAFERAAAANGPRERRHQLAHLELVDPADFARMAQLGVAANVQPAWAWHDRSVAEVEPLLGAQRARWLYPLGSLVASGALLVAGSDWPSTPMNPFPAMRIAITRRPPDGGPAWLPEQRVGVHALMLAYTLGGARIAGAERSTGSLVPGKSADLVVLDRDPYAVSASRLAKTRVLLTLLEGQVVYRARGGKALTISP